MHFLFIGPNRLFGDDGSQACLLLFQKEAFNDPIFQRMKTDDGQPSGLLKMIKRFRDRFFKGAELVMIPRAAHLPSIETPGAFNDVLRPFLQRF